MKTALIVGTRPEIIKMSPIIRYCESMGLDYFLIHTGQHYSYTMDKVFFDELELPLAKYSLDIGSGLHGQQTGRMLEKIEGVIAKDLPDVVLVEGDTNTVLAGALAASKLGVKVGHVEAGLRSYDRSMPEEINRVLTDHISDFLFAPTEETKKIAEGEGIPSSRIFVTGNTIVDAVFQNIELAKLKSNALNRLGLAAREYILVTIHRQENVDNETKLKSILSAFKEVFERHHLPLIYPIHPRTKKMIDRFGLNIPGGIKMMDPLGFLDFLQLEANAKLVMTDSGGVQEETCILRVPCITLRENTERPETITAGGNILAGTEKTRIIDAAARMIVKERNWKNPFGDGRSGERIMELILASKRP